MKTFECDSCGIEAVYDLRWVWEDRRPSTGELVEVVWFCSQCGYESNAIPPDKRSIQT